MPLSTFENSARAGRGLAMSVKGWQGPSTGWQGVEGLGKGLAMALPRCMSYTRVQNTPNGSRVWVSHVPLQYPGPSKVAWYRSRALARELLKSLRAGHFTKTQVLATSTCDQPIVSIAKALPRFWSPRLRGRAWMRPVNFQRYTSCHNFTEFPQART